MAQETFDIPVTELPFEVGNGGFATMSVSEGIAHVTVSVADTKTKTRKTVAKGDGNDFLKKWGGALTSRDIFRKEAHLHDPRMLHYIEKYGLDA
ncbi:MAG: hypothetical protein ACON4K_12920 [Akkermansiaceae bacterium]